MPHSGTVFVTPSRDPEGGSPPADTDTQYTAILDGFTTILGTVMKFNFIREIEILPSALFARLNTLDQLDVLFIAVSKSPVIPNDLTSGICPPPDRHSPNTPPAGTTPAIIPVVSVAAIHRGGLSATATQGGPRSPADNRTADHAAPQGPPILSSQELGPLTRDQITDRTTVTSRIFHVVPRGRGRT